MSLVFSALQDDGEGKRNGVWRTQWTTVLDCERVSVITSTISPYIHNKNYSYLYLNPIKQNKQIVTRNMAWKYTGRVQAWWNSRLCCGGPFPTKRWCYLAMNPLGCSGRWLPVNSSLHTQKAVETGLYINTYSPQNKLLQRYQENCGKSELINIPKSCPTWFKRPIQCISNELLKPIIWNTLYVTISIYKRCSQRTNMPARRLL